MTFLLAHLSDPHLGPLPPVRPADLMGKRVTGFINWRRRRHIHDMDTLGRLVDDLRARKPDHVMMTGDVTNLGLPGEFRRAAGWLETLGAASDVSFVPGNHDVYTHESGRGVEREFARWTHGGGADATWPYVRERGGVAIIGVNSGVPTALFMATGSIGEAQRARLARVLEETRSRGLTRIVMIHHAPWRGGATPGRGLRDVRAFEAIIARHGAELIVHGHNHKSFVAHLPGPRGKVPVVGVRSASAVPGTARHLAGYHLYRIHGAGESAIIEASARGLAPGGREIVDLGPITL